MTLKASIICLSQLSDLFLYLCINYVYTEKIFIFYCIGKNKDVNLRLFF